MAVQRRDAFGRFAGKRSLPAPKRDSKGRFVAGKFRGKRFVKKKEEPEEERLLDFTITARTKYRDGPKATPEISVSGVATEPQIRQLRSAMVDYLREFLRGGQAGGPVVVGDVDTSFTKKGARHGIRDVSVYRRNRRLVEHEKDFANRMRRLGI